SSGIPNSSTRYALPGIPTCLLSRAVCSRTPVARSIQGSLCGSDHAPRSGKLGFHRHTPPRCPVLQAEPHSHSTKGLAPLSLGTEHPGEVSSGTERAKLTHSGAI